jgi:predicted phosphohydrolase
VIPSPDQPEDDDVKIYARERMRLEMSLKSARAKDKDAPITVMMHYPPLTEELPGFSDILEAYGVEDCVYGHLHGGGLYGAVRGERRGVRYHQVSCDGLDFKLYLLYA